MSARTGQGLDALRDAIAEIATAEAEETDAGLPSVLAEFPELHEASDATQTTQSGSNAIRTRTRSRMTSGRPSSVTITRYPSTDIELLRNCIEPASTPAV